MTELGFKRPSQARMERTAQKAAAKLGDAEKRIVADVPEHIHKQMRIRCMERGLLVRDYILELLARDGIQ